MEPERLAIVLTRRDYNEAKKAMEATAEFAAVQEAQKALEATPAYRLVKAREAMIEQAEEAFDGEPFAFCEGCGVPFKADDSYCGSEDGVYICAGDGSACFTDGSPCFSDEMKALGLGS